MRRPCNHCGYVAVNPDDNTTKRMLGNHMRYRHPEHHKPLQKCVRKNPLPVASVADPATGQPATPAKRTWSRVKKSTLDVNFCPGCGCNLRAVKVAMGLL